MRRLCSERDRPARTGSSAPRISPSSIRAQVLASQNTPQRRERPAECPKQLIAALFETVKVGGGRIVSVQPKAVVMPLVVVTMTEAGGKDWRSRPGSDPER